MITEDQKRESCILLNKLKIAEYNKSAQKFKSCALYFMTQASNKLYYWRKVFPF